MRLEAGDTPSHVKNPDPNFFEKTQFRLKKMMWTARYWTHLRILRQTSIRKFHKSNTCTIRRQAIFPSDWWLKTIKNMNIVVLWLISFIEKMLLRDTSLGKKRFSPTESECFMFLPTKQKDGVYMRQLIRPMTEKIKRKMNIISSYTQKWISDPAKRNNDYQIHVYTNEPKTISQILSLRMQSNEKYQAWIIIIDVVVIYKVFTLKHAGILYLNQIFTETNLWLLQTIKMNIRQLPDHMNTPHIDKMKMSISTNYSRPNRRPCIDSESEDAIEWKNDRKWIITIDMITIYKDSHWIKQRFLFWIRFSPKRIFELCRQSKWIAHKFLITW